MTLLPTVEMLIAELYLFHNWLTLHSYQTELNQLWTDLELNYDTNVFIELLSSRISFCLIFVIFLLCINSCSILTDPKLLNSMYVVIRVIWHCYLVDDAGSVVCLCMRCVRRTKCSLMESCTSAGMSGEVWLILTAASNKPIDAIEYFSFSVAIVTSDGWGLGRRDGKWNEGQSSGARAAELDERALFLQGTQHSFQETNAASNSSAKPHAIITPMGRPTAKSTAGRKQWAAQYGQTDGQNSETDKKSALEGSNEQWLLFMELFTVIICKSNTEFNTKHTLTITQCRNDKM